MQQRPEDLCFTQGLRKCYIWLALVLYIERVLVERRETKSKVIIMRALNHNWRKLRNERIKSEPEFR